MKLATAETVAESSFDDSAATTMGIENNAHMFSLLSDKLYTNKPKAIIREICCNALDASDTPFLISIGEELSIRDFGPGMSHAFMMGGYTRIGHSTKTNSNSEIGGFGIGRMSIFSYADEYIVTSITDAKRTYLVYKTGGLPAIQLLTTEQTEEKTGVEIKVPISPSDRLRFVDAAHDTLRWFPAGSFQTFGFKVETLTPSMVGEGFEIHPSSSHTQILVGPVAYRHDVELPACIVLRFEVGEIQPAPNRESLSMDAITAKAIQDRVEHVREALPRMITAKAETMHPVDRLQMIASLRANYKMRDLLRAWVRNNFENFNAFGTILPRNLERVSIPAKVAKYDRGRGGSHAKPTVWDDYEITDTRPLADRWIFNDVDSKYPKVIERLRHAYVFGYVVHPSEEVPTAAALQLLLKKDVELLSAYPEPPAAYRAPRGRYQAEFWHQGRKHDRTTPEDVQIYIEHDAPWNVSGYCDLQMVRPHKVWVLSKEGRRRFPNAVHIKDWVLANLPKPDPAAIAARDAYQAVANHALVSHMMRATTLPAPLQRLKAEIQQVKALSESASDYRSLVNMGVIKKPKATRDLWRLKDKVQKAEARNKVAMALLTHRWSSSLIEEVLR